MENPNEHPTQAAINELTLALLYLTRFGTPKNRVLRTSWLEYDREATHQLLNVGFLTHRSRYQAFLSDDGLVAAKEVLKKYNIPDWD